MVNKTCLTCGKDFLVRPYQFEIRKHCSKNCRPKVSTSKVCLTCQKEFYIKPSAFETAKYCSKKCFSSRSFLKNCFNCNAVIKVKNCKLKAKNFCSQGCYFASLNKEKPASDKIRLEQEVRICKSCNEEKPLNKFGARIKNGKLICPTICNLCKTKIYRHGAPNPVSKNRNDIKEGQETKICIRCNEEKPLRSFASHRKKNGNVGRSAKCGSCRNGLPIDGVKAYFPYQKNGVWVKFCAGCKTLKPLKDFQKKQKSYGYCRICNSAKSSLHAKNASPEAKKRMRANAKKNAAIRRARQSGANVVVAFTIDVIIRRDGLICYLCDKKLTAKTATIEHILPLSRGGNHTPENVKIACGRCNSSKGFKTLTEFKKWRGDYDRFKNSVISSSVYL